MEAVARCALILAAILLQASCAFPLPPPLESCQQLATCPDDKRDILFQINAGGGLIPPFAADTLFTDGASQSNAAEVDLSQVDSPAPEAIYQSFRFASGTSFQYTFAQLEPNRAHFVRLHFADPVQSPPGDHIFNVEVNGQLMLNQVDIVLEAHGANRALIREFGVSSDDQGVLQLSFVSLPAKGAAEVSGLEIWRPK